MDRCRVNEESDKTINFTIRDSTGTPVPSADLTVAELTLFDVDTSPPSPDGSPAAGIINGRLNQDVLNTNDVTIDSATSPIDYGFVAWTMQPSDNIIVTSRRQVERHRAMFHFEWATGAFNYEIEIEVVNLRKAG